MQEVLTSHSTRSVSCTCLVAGRNMPGQHLRELPSNVPRRELELRNTCGTPGGIECNGGSMLEGVGGVECELQARRAAANRVSNHLRRNS